MLKAAVCLAVVTWATSASALDLRISGFATNRFNLRGHYRDSNLLFDVAANRFDTAAYLQPQPTEAYYSGFAELSLDLDATAWFAARLTANSGEIRLRSISLDGTTTRTETWTANGRPVADEAVHTAFVREAFLDFHDGDTAWWQVRIGRRLWRVASSLIYDDFGLGAGASFDFNLRQGTPWRFEVAYIIPTRDFQPLPLGSPFVMAKVDYVLSLFESLSLGGAYFYDGNGELGETFRQGVVEGLVTARNPYPVRASARHIAYETARQRLLGQAFSQRVSSNTHLGYAFFTGNKTLGPGVLAATVVGSAGKTVICSVPGDMDDETQFQLACDKATQTIGLLGLAFDVSYRWSVTDRVQLTPFVFGESGSGPVQRGQQGPYTAYLGVLPFITRTNLFFVGGLSETFGARQLTAAGVNGRGVIAPGVTLIADPIDTLRLKGTIAVLNAWAGGLRPPVGGRGSFYGIECDSVIDWRPFDFLGFVAEGDVLFGGSFYGTSEPVFKVIAGLDLSFVWEPLTP